MKRLPGREFMPGRDPLPGKKPLPERSVLRLAAPGHSFAVGAGKKRATASGAVGDRDSPPARGWSLNGGGSVRQARIKGVAEAVANHIQAENRDRDEQPWGEYQVRRIP